MCGIAGYVGALKPDLLPQMIHALKHRGPDDEGFHVETGVGLEMARLAIIDLVTGRRPMASAGGAFTRVFNGEIYNFREPRGLHCPAILRWWTLTWTGSPRRSAHEIDRPVRGAIRGPRGRGWRR